MHVHLALVVDRAARVDPPVPVIGLERRRRPKLIGRRRLNVIVPVDQERGSVGIDMALTLTSRLADETVARAIQLGIEYDLHPPFDAGSPDKAGKEIVELAMAALSGTA